MKVKMGADEEWKKAAMADDTMVAELLLTLNQAVPTPAPPQPPPKAAFPVDWTVRRQRRSRAVTVNSGKKPVQRASPTTPLSWSGATSGSGAGGGGSGSGGGVDGGSEESSEPPLIAKKPESARSKVTSETAGGKRPRKKKTLAELKEEEIALLKERKQLKKELCTMRVNLEKERATNENLKRMKLDLEPPPRNERGTSVSIQEAISGQTEKIATCDPPAAFSPKIVPGHDGALQMSPAKYSPEVQKEVARFVLPDLNLPLEEEMEECSTEVLCEVS